MNNKKVCLVAITLYFTNFCFASGFDLKWDWIVSSQTSSTQKNAFNSLNEGQQHSINGVLDVEINYGELTGSFALKGSDLYHSDNNQKSEAEFIISELFWLDSVSIAQYELDLQFGKSRIDWGVGYGYRPLDIFSNYRRNPVGIQIEEGVGVAALSYFDLLGEWTFIYTNSTLNNQKLSNIEEKNEQQGVGIRRYGMINNTEYQSLIYYDDVRRGLIAGSLVTVIDNAWEFHGSVVYQQRFLSYQQDEYTLEIKEQNDAYQALLGLTWTDIIGNTLIAEYWYDSRAWDRQTWDKAINGGSPVYQQGYLHSNIVQHNIMLHWQLDSSAWKNWQWSQGSLLDKLTPSIDLLYSPADNGLIATQWLSYLLNDSGDSQSEVQLAARFFTGKAESAYANLPEKHTILLNFKGRF